MFSFQTKKQLRILITLLLSSNSSYCIYLSIYWPTMAANIQWVSKIQLDVWEYWTVLCCFCAVFVFKGICFQWEITPRKSRWSLYCLISTIISYMYNYLCNQCLSPQKLLVRSPFMARFSPRTLDSSTNKTNRHDITETLLTVALRTINQ